MRRLNVSLAIVAGWLTMVMGFLGCLEVIARTAFGRPTAWSLPISQYLLITAAFLGTAYCLQSDGHINIELFIDRLRGRTKKTLLLLGYVLSGVYIAVALVYTLKATVLAVRFNWNVVTDFPIPAVVLYAVMIFGWALLLLTCGLMLAWTARNGR